MGKRGFNFYSGLIFREYLVELPSIIFASIAQWGCPFQMIRGIRVADPIAETRPYFTNAVAKALELIAISDPMRFKRLQREIRIIVNTAMATGSQCSGPDLKICSVDFRYCYDQDFAKTVEFLAADLIYVATYNDLIRRGILWTKHSRGRFTAIRCKEVRRFLRRAGVTNSPWDSESFDPRSRWLLLKDGVKEMRGILTRDAAAEAAIWKEQINRQEEE